MPKGKKKKTTGLSLQHLKTENFSAWYNEIIYKAELIDEYDISGCFILRPYSYAIWETIQGWFDAEIKKLGVRNAYFPCFVTEAALCKEEDHIEGACNYTMSLSSSPALPPRARGCCNRCECSEDDLVLQRSPPHERASCCSSKVERKSLIARSASPACAPPATPPSPSSPPRRLLPSSRAAAELSSSRARCCCERESSSCDAVHSCAISTLRTLAGGARPRHSSQHHLVLCLHTATRLVQRVSAHLFPRHTSSHRSSRSSHRCHPTQALLPRSRGSLSTARLTSRNGSRFARRARRLCTRRSRNGSGRTVTCRCG